MRLQWKCKINSGYLTSVLQKPFEQALLIKTPCGCLFIGKWPFSYSVSWSDRHYLWTSFLLTPNFADIHLYMLFAQAGFVLTQTHHKSGAGLCQKMLADINLVPPISRKNILRAWPCSRESCMAKDPLPSWHHLLLFFCCLSRTSLLEQSPLTVSGCYCRHCVWARGL